MSRRHDDGVGNIDDGQNRMHEEMRMGARSERVLPSATSEKHSGRKRRREEISGPVQREATSPDIASLYSHDQKRQKRHDARDARPYRHAGYADSRRDDRRRRRSPPLPGSYRDRRPDGRDRGGRVVRGQPSQDRGTSRDGMRQAGVGDPTARAVHDSERKRHSRRVDDASRERGDGKKSKKAHKKPKGRVLEDDDEKEEGEEPSVEVQELNLVMAGLPLSFGSTKGKKTGSSSNLSGARVKTKRKYRRFVRYKFKD